MKKFLLFILVTATSFMCGFAATAPSNQSDTIEGTKIMREVCKDEKWDEVDKKTSSVKELENGVRRAIGNKDDSSPSSNPKDNSNSSSGNGSGSSSNSGSGSSSSYGSSSGSSSSGSSSSGSTSNSSNKPSSGSDPANKSENCQSTTCGQGNFVNSLTPNKDQ